MAGVGRGVMFFHNNTVLIVFVIGVILLIIGFGLRDRNPGMVLLGIGLLATLYAVVKKAIELFS
jgi:hypothetical protein|tara:strand:+ start:702 stop:893 length:192 start_codon:yes stop_codon:yes gene_type:complete